MSDRASGTERHARQYSPSMKDRSRTYATTNWALWTPRATSTIRTAIAAIASMAAKYATRNRRSSVSNRVA